MGSVAGSCPWAMENQLDTLWAPACGVRKEQGYPSQPGKQEESRGRGQYSWDSVPQTHVYVGIWKSGWDRHPQRYQHQDDGRGELSLSMTFMVLPGECLYK